MNLRQLATGILSGYATKAIQLAASVILVPFLLDPGVMGVEEYGRVFAIFGLTSMIGMATIGIQLSVETAIAQAIGGVSRSAGHGVSELLGGGSKILLIANLALVIPLVLFDTSLLGLIGIPDEPRYRFSILAAAAVSIFENSLYLLRAPLLARGDIAFVNLIGMLEITGRTAAVFAIFSLVGGNLATFMGLQAGFTLARQLAYLARLDRSDTRGLLFAPLSGALEAARYAKAVTLAEGASILARGAPVMLASRYLGPVEAGYVALVANTLQGYFLQVFHAVVAPIAVPIAARFRLADLTPSRRRSFMDLEAVYSMGIAIAFGEMILWTPRLIPLWLGAEFEAIILPTQIMLMGAGVQTCNIIRRSVLIGQGDLPLAVPTLVGAALISTMLVAVSTALLHSWISAIVFSSGCLVLSAGLGVDRVFSAKFGDSDGGFRLPRIASFALVFFAAWLLGRPTRSAPPTEALAWSIAGFLVMTAVATLTIISASRATRLVSRLYRSREIDLFR